VGCLDSARKSLQFAGDRSDERLVRSDFVTGIILNGSNAQLLKTSNPTTKKKLEQKVGKKVGKEVGKKSKKVEK
jgi:hypothetical protein